MKLKSEQNVKNKISAIGALAVPVLRYCFGIINWILAEIRQTGRKTRKILTMYKIHHPKTDVDRLYVKREGDSGLLRTEATNKAEIINTVKYLNTKYAEKQ